MSEYEQRALREELSQVVLVPAGAAGAGFTFKPAAVERSRIRSVAFQLVTSAVVANRIVTLTLTNADGGTLCELPANAVQAASLTWQYTFALGLTPYNVTAAAAEAAPLPDMWLPAGGSVVIGVGAVDVADKIAGGFIVLDQVYALGG